MSRKRSRRRRSRPKPRPRPKRAPCESKSVPRVPGTLVGDCRRHKAAWLERGTISERGSERVTHVCSEGKMDGSRVNAVELDMIFSMSCIYQRPYSDASSPTDGTWPQCQLSNHVHEVMVAEPFAPSTARSSSQWTHIHVISLHFSRREDAF